MFKSDVAEAYRHMPMSFYWSIKQVNTIDGERSLDLCNAFGGRGAQAIWIAFMALVIWIAKYIRLIHLLLAYSDNAFGPNMASDFTFYPPYKNSLPTNQVKFLVLLDDLGIPHSEKKQISGAPLVIIGIKVDPNRMTLTLPTESRLDLIDKISRFCETTKNKKGSKFSLREWQGLGGHLNWSFNVFPLLKPCTCALYAKIAGKDAPNAAIWVNNNVRDELLWARARLMRESGVRLVRSVDWQVPSADITIYCDASLEGFGFYIPANHTGFYGDIPSNTPKNLIFFYEALCVIFALYHTASSSIPCPGRIVIYTDSENSVNIFSSLHALPQYNILLAACDFLMDTMHQLRVVHVPGRDNSVADALSRKLFRLANRWDPRLTTKHFIPPDSLLGALHL
ncbi:hypothetical protein D9615_005642 [Tricholomella constricta]|uniref:Uncharacterized protein n=1 Tax=Tricholomella constricta TaxID=117010 RepID=A0A8H5M5L5_9AGAR|nr:hypothetical protein D9615_005642 [Tricholomella constricta]